MWDYGRENDFGIWINGEKLGIEDLEGKSHERIIDVDGKRAVLKYTVTPKPIKQSGIVLRVKNKIIGRPINVLSNDEIIPKKLKSRIIGELICDDLDEHVTADYGAVSENSKLFNSLINTTTKEIKQSVDTGQTHHKFKTFKR